MSVHPGLIVYASAKAHDLTFDALFFTLTLWAFWRLQDKPSIGRALAAGCIVGVGAHSRGTTVIFLPIARSGCCGGIRADNGGSWRDDGWWRRSAPSRWSRPGPLATV